MSKTQTPNRCSELNFKGLGRGVPPYGIGAIAPGLQPAHLLLTRKGLIDWDTARTENRASIR